MAFNPDCSLDHPFASYANDLTKYDKLQSDLLVQFDWPLHQHLHFSSRSQNVISNEQHAATAHVHGFAVSNSRRVLT